MNLTIDGQLPRVGDFVKVKRGPNKLQNLVGRVILRRNKSTGFTTHRASLGRIWVKFGKESENNVKIEPLLPSIMVLWEPVKKKGQGRGSVNKLAILDGLDFGNIFGKTDDVLEGVEI